MHTNNIFTQAQSMIMRARCPGCANQALELRLYCEIGHGCCYRARCTECKLELDVLAHKIPVTIDPLLSDLSCPECSHTGARKSMVCWTKSRQCEPVIVCRHCEHILMFSTESRPAATAHC